MWHEELIKKSLEVIIRLEDHEKSTWYQSMGERAALKKPACFKLSSRACSLIVDTSPSHYQNSKIIPRGSPSPNSGCELKEERRLWKMVEGLKASVHLLEGQKASALAAGL